MYAELYPGNTAGVTCYVCQKMPTGVDAFQLLDLAYPYDWMCSPCLVEALRTGTLFLSNAEPERTTCNNCGEVTEEGAYCQDCFDSQSENALDDHECEATCNYCGDYVEVYCVDHAKEQWELTEVGIVICDECGDEADRGESSVLCYECRTERENEDVRITAAAAAAIDGIEVEWDEL